MNGIKVRLVQPFNKIIIIFFFFLLALIIRVGYLILILILIRLISGSDAMNIVFRLTLAQKATSLRI